MASGSVVASDPTSRRIASMLRIAADHGTGLAPETLTDLLPAGDIGSRADVLRWITDHPEEAAIVDGRAVRPGTPVDPVRSKDRSARGRDYLAEARRLAEIQLAGARPMIACLCVTGSTAYGEPEVGDDLDFLVVTRSGSLWLVLAYAYLVLRLRRPPAPDVGAPCFNFVLEESEARREFAQPQGPLFARESLMARPVIGEHHFRGLIAAAPWMKEEFPRLYARWERDGLPSLTPGARAPVALRALNLFLFPALATYLQLMGLLRNWRFHRQGHPERVFRTITHFRRLAFASVRFERLRRTYDGAGAPSAGAA